MWVEYVGPDGKRASREHWTKKGDVKLFLWQKAPPSARTKGTVLFVHGSSMASQPTFDLQVPGPAGFLGDGLVRRARLRHLDAWTWRATAARTRRAPINCDIANGADDLAAGRLHPADTRREEADDLRHLLGRAARGAVRAAPSRARRAARARRVRLDRRRAARRSTERKKKLPEFQAKNRRPIDRAFVHSDLRRATIPACADERDDRGVRRRDPRARRLDADRHLRRHVLEAAARRPGEDQRADASSCAASTTASPRFDDLIEFFARLPNPDKQFTVMAGISHASFQQKNYLMRLSHPARLLHPTRAGIPRMKRFLFAFVVCGNGSRAQALRKPTLAPGAPRGAAVARRLRRHAGAHARAAAVRAARQAVSSSRTGPARAAPSAGISSPSPRPMATRW